MKREDILAWFDEILAEIFKHYQKKSELQNSIWQDLLACGPLRPSSALAAVFKERHPVRQSWTNVSQIKKPKLRQCCAGVDLHVLPAGCLRTADSVPSLTSSALSRKANCSTKQRFSSMPTIAPLQP